MTKYHLSADETRALSITANVLAEATTRFQHAQLAYRMVMNSLKEKYKFTADTVYPIEQVGEAWVITDDEKEKEESIRKQGIQQYQKMKQRYVDEEVTKEVKT